MGCSFFGCFKGSTATVETQASAQPTLPRDSAELYCDIAPVQAYPQASTLVTLDQASLSSHLSEDIEVLPEKPKARLVQVDPVRSPEITPIAPGYVLATATIDTESYTGPTRDSGATHDVGATHHGNTNYQTDTTPSHCAASTGNATSSYCAASTSYATGGYGGGGDTGAGTDGGGGY